jgi:2,4-dienoyl-CoA reductase-like NADH-dependent reductase (Old Yellow Enzyme family)/thioredoxin reductase
MGSNYKHVFSPIEIRGVKYKNRIHMAPTSPKLTDPKGFMTTEHIEYFRTIAKGGAGIITLGNCTVDIEHYQDEPRQVALDNDHYIPGLTRLVDMFELYGVVGQLELNHAGLDASWDLNRCPAIGPTAQHMPMELMKAALLGRPPVRAEAMTYEQIKEIQQKYIDAAFRCKRAGMNTVFVHAGHANLIGQFSSPLYNRRTDEYGGSLENRARFCMEILEGIRKKCGEDFVIELRVSADEIHPDGMHFEEAKRYLQMMDGMFDILSVSAGLHTDKRYFKYFTPNMFRGEMVNVGYAAELKKILKCKISVAGGIDNLTNAEKVISEGWADFCLLARGLMADPEMPRKYAFNKPEEVRPCTRCNYCGKRITNTKTLACAVNPKLGREMELVDGEVPRARRKKKVVVVGGGPAGMQATLTLLERGHDVILLEKEEHLGGNLIAAAAMPLKVGMQKFRDYFIRKVTESGADIRLNCEATPELISSLAPDALVIAVGAVPSFPDVPGIDLPHVYSCLDAELGKCETGDRIVVIGGASLGLECGASFAMLGKNVTVIEMLPQLPYNPTQGNEQLTEMIEKAGGKVITGRRLAGVWEDRVLCVVVGSGKLEEYPCDTVLMATGMKAREGVVEALRHVIPETEIHIVGDARKPQMLGDAIRGSFDAALAI